MNKNHSSHRPRTAFMDLTAKALGLLLFLVGVALLLVSFRVAFDMFDNMARASHVWVVAPTRPGKEPSGAEIGVGIVVVLLKIALLFAMGFLASLVSTKGISLYSAAAGAPLRLLQSQPSPPSAPEQAESDEQ